MKKHQHMGGLASRNRSLGWMEISEEAEDV